MLYMSRMTNCSYAQLQGIGGLCTFDPGAHPYADVRTVHHSKRKGIKSFKQYRSNVGLHMSAFVTWRPYLASHKRGEDKQVKRLQCRLSHQPISGRRLVAQLHVVENQHVEDEQAGHAHLKQNLCGETEDGVAKGGHELMHSG